MERAFQTLIILILCQSILPAQVRFLLDYNARIDEYTVSMMPERTWRSPKNKTATGQVTLKATTGQFFIQDIKSHVKDTDWVPSGRINSPEESPKYDYIFFRLETPGLTEMPYQAFVAVKLFSFTLQSNCAREVMLMNNKEDAFRAPNSRSVNVGNSLGVLGANGEAYAGNVSVVPIFCPYAAAAPDITEAQVATDKKLVSITTDKTNLISRKLLYPNPTAFEVQVDLDWIGKSGEKDILVYNSAGELVKSYQVEIIKGTNNFTMDVSKLGTGIYNFLLADNEENLTLGKVIKVQ